MKGLGIGWLLALTFAGVASGAPVVYHSPGDSGLRPPVAPYVQKATNVTLYLWLDPGGAPLSGTLCNNASGDASCAYDLRVQVLGDSKIVSFTPVGLASEVVQKLTPPTNATMLRANRILTGAAAIVGPKKLGTLVVDTTGPQGGTIDVTGVHSLGAALQLDAIPTNTLVFVPEPGELTGLLSGLAALALLHRLRGSR